MRDNQITVFDPFRFLSDDFGDRFLPTYQMSECELNLFEDEENVVAEIKLPGFKADNVDISVEDNVLSIAGKMEDEKVEDDKKRKYYRKEIRSESFTRSVNLPVKVEAEKAEANFKDGILTVTLPKSQDQRPKRVEIKTEK